MKGILLAAWLLAALATGRAHADGANDDGDFWASMVAPHAEEIELILRHARELRTAAMQFAVAADFGYPNPYNDVQREQRTRRQADAFGMLRYAVRELDPEHPELLYELGRVADDLGRYAAAAAALTAFLAHAKAKDRRRAEAHVRLGRIAARRGAWNDAIEHLRTALGGADASVHGQALVYLGCAYMQAERMAEAIDALEQASNTTPYGQMYYLAQTAQFALALAYDRDEQITRSHEVLERLLGYDAGLNYALGQPSYDYTGNGLDSEPLLWPPAERHYFMAFRYEAMNLLDDARAEWQAYVRAADDGAFRDRASSHIEAIDRMRDEQMREAAAPKKARPARGATQPTGATP